MAFDIIAFTQDELDKAVRMGASLIALCDNSFKLPSAAGVTYTVIGSADVSADMTDKQLQELGIHCVGFSVKTLSESKETAQVCAAENIITCHEASYTASYATSYQTSYLSSYNLLGSYSFVTSYRYGYGSGAYSYTASYVSSYTTSYTASYIGSCTSLYNSTYTEAFDSAEECGTQTQECVIMVNGYGINLI